MRIGGTWAHIGVAFNNRGPVPVYNYFLLDDEGAAAERLYWSESLYPAALPGPWTYENIPRLTEENE